MILADSSIWIDHLRDTDRDMAAMLNAGRILTHPFIIGEIALGSMRNRRTILHMLRRLPEVVQARNAEVDMLIEQIPLFNLGIGYIDAHLLVSARLTPGSSIWTRDRRLLQAAALLGVDRHMDRPH
ncbi:type II toxin-antitoxin system VapC family toxin [Sphingobium sp. AP49]|uniref:type II toxin-antitoxin system VapC family toxin n=1 Tax=Sphingobium sp. AP49 TaxID=1144307 RepID=UPI00026EE32D|nr:type II toxin-antitoxin system VapC family toxin [Sphingobium sp. AP49]WHO39564.1 type II toxin-antitoxin system VapC family toxin [Sphingobium sp. AP49]